MPKIEPAVMTLNFSLDSESELTPQFIDLSQCASLVNRRFYRAGLNWAVAGFSWHTDAEGALQVSKIPDTWIARNAWVKALASWNRMNREALEENESVRPKFYDFKVFADADHYQKRNAGGYTDNLIPMDFARNEYTKGEWEYSQVSIPKAYDVEQPDGTDTMADFALIWTGSSYPGKPAGPAVETDDAVSLIEGYASSRALPYTGDPNVPDDMSDTAAATPENWITAMFNEGTTQSHEVLEELATQNDTAPYPFENVDQGHGAITDTMYPGGANQAPGVQVHDYSFATPTTIGGTTRLKGGNFMGGLIRIDYLNANSSIFQIHLVPGTHRGYLAQPIKDM